ncbi:polynucleotide 3'-phosphatase ZDP [Cocos nucifera]|uniref:Polynucleotide 3'-phosphatase ZDP n=1 Tax=Cocos nucifera TaxID=13894 RepID=A0A8K0IUA4_COCNU|nr:polynucleotide 3'-phosphatase ZDP [Cocos nucifera]
MLLLFPYLSILARSPGISTLHLSVLAKSPKISTLPFLAARARLPPLAFASLSPMAPPPKVVGEYAKSGRSSCKNCGKAIAAGSLRVGSSSKDPRGFDHVKWYHLDCFPARDHPLAAAEEILGFSSLKSFDQDALRKLEATASSEQTVNELGKTDWDATKDLEERGSKKPKLSSTDEAGNEEFTQKNSPVVPHKVVAEYAKSNRSSCKNCRNAIAAGSLRLGSSSKDPRGFDLMKWYHLDCFPTQSHLLIAVEEITGFFSLRNCDQDALRKLEAAASSSQTAMKIHKRDGSAIEELEEKDSKKPKLLADGKKNDFRMAFSVSDIKDQYKDATLSPKWKAFKTLIFREREEGLFDSEKIAAFDFDGCLMNTSVKRCRIHPDAWSLMYPSVPEKLQGLYNSGYKLVIFTNESNIERWKKKRQQAVDSKIGRLDNFIKHVKVPIQVFIACGLGTSKDQTEDPFRKPKPGMWRLMEEQFNSGIAVDMDRSFYVGDAAGRVNDHSDADIKFAEVVGLKFHVPEEFFGT